MKLKKIFTFSAMAFLGTFLAQPIFAENHISHHLPSATTPGKLGSEYLNDIEVINYSMFPISVAVKFADGHTETDTLMSYGMATNNRNIDYIDLADDSNAYVVLTANGKAFFHSNVQKGQVVKIYPQEKDKSKPLFRVTVK